MTALQLRALKLAKSFTKAISYELLEVKENASDRFSALCRDLINAYIGLPHFEKSLIPVNIEKQGTIGLSAKCHILLARHCMLAGIPGPQLAYVLTIGHVPTGYTTELHILA